MPQRQTCIIYMVNYINKHYFFKVEFAVWTSWKHICVKKNIKYFNLLQLIASYYQKENTLPKTGFLWTVQHLSELPEADRKPTGWPHFPCPLSAAGYSHHKCFCVPLSHRPIYSPLLSSTLPNGQVLRPSEQQKTKSNTSTFVWLPMWNSCVNNG